MEEKIYYLKNGKAIKIGDMLTYKKHTTTELGSITRTTSFMVTEDNIKALLRKKVLFMEKPEAPQKEKEVEYLMTLCNNITKYIAKRYSLICVENMHELFYGLYDIGRGLFISFILREYAKMLDEKYKNNIKEEKEIYIVSITDFSIHKFIPTKDTDFRNFAAFRSAFEAAEAKEVVSKMVSDLDELKSKKRHS